MWSPETCSGTSGPPMCHSDPPGSPGHSDIEWRTGLPSSQLFVAEVYHFEIITVYRELFSSGNFLENAARKVCKIFTESYFCYFNDSQ